MTAARQIRCWCRCGFSGFLCMKRMFLFVFVDIHVWACSALKSKTKIARTVFYFFFYRSGLSSSAIEIWTMSMNGDIPYVQTTGRTIFKQFTLWYPKRIRIGYWPIGSLFKSATVCLFLWRCFLPFFFSLLIFGNARLDDKERQGNDKKKKQYFSKVNAPMRRRNADWWSVCFV